MPVGGRPGPEPAPSRHGVDAGHAHYDLAESPVHRAPAHPALVSEEDFIAAQGIHAARGPAPEGDLAGLRGRRYLLSGLLICGACGRRMESACR